MEIKISKRILSQGFIVINTNSSRSQTFLNIFVPRNHILRYASKSGQTEKNNNKAIVKGGSQNSSLNN
jgi:hypothetical protein